MRMPTPLLVFCFVPIARAGQSVGSKGSCGTTAQHGTAHHVSQVWGWILSTIDQPCDRCSLGRLLEALAGCIGIQLSAHMLLSPICQQKGFKEGRGECREGGREGGGEREGGRGEGERGRGCAYLQVEQIVLAKLFMCCMLRGQATHPQVCIHLPAQAAAAAARAGRSAAHPTAPDQAWIACCTPHTCLPHADVDLGTI